MSYTNGLDDPTLYFNTKLYTGNGSTQSITGVGFQPDWIWLKSRTTAEFHTVYDSVRGSASNYKQLYTNSTNAEVTPGTAGLTAIGTDGFTLGANDNSNASSQNFVSWNWLAGGTASSNTDGSITSSVSANTTAGFSIVSYTGNGGTATVGHGLGVVPKMIIAKRRSETGNWDIYNSNLGNNKSIFLNTTDASFTDNTWNSTTPTSSVFTVGNNNVNRSGTTLIAYCFAEKKGFSKFGSYTGNGSTDGTFVYTGFKPAFVLAKKTNEQFTSWIILDNKRANSFNPIEKRIFANLSNAEDSSSNYCDLVSNGFKFRTSDNNANDTDDSYIYMAFAESPFVTSTGIPTTAR